MINTLLVVLAGVIFGIVSVLNAIISNIFSFIKDALELGVGDNIRTIAITGGFLYTILEVTKVLVNVN